MAFRLKFVRAPMSTPFSLSIFRQSILPPHAAKCTAVQPLWSVALKSAPSSSNTFIHSAWPSSATYIRTVCESTLAKLTSAPRFTASRMPSTLPFFPHVKRSPCGEALIPLQTFRKLSALSLASLSSVGGLLSRSSARRSNAFFLNLVRASKFTPSSANTSRTATRPCWAAKCTTVQPSASVASKLAPCTLRSFTHSCIPERAASIAAVAPPPSKFSILSPMRGAFTSAPRFSACCTSLNFPKDALTHNSSCAFEGASTAATGISFSLPSIAHNTLCRSLSDNSLANFRNSSSGKFAILALERAEAPPPIVNNHTQRERGPK
mmetsp:Transcript_81578/g.205264  ORF Transcript_81578/g.205264 Transcript_81578/m.205264 type:complete len:322 (+) Transcript_81578:1178-2143(+)